MGKRKQRVDTSGGESLTHNPFGALDSLGGLPAGPEEPPPSAEDRGAHAKPSAAGQRGRVDIVRQTAHRGGKSVTVLTNFTGVAHSEKQELARKLQKACGVGGTVKDGNIEIQGDRREDVKKILEEAGFRPVFAGG